MNRAFSTLGEDYHDPRGRLRFFNQLDLQEVRRMYQVRPENIELIRAWQAHKEEKKWFYCVSGAFVVNLIRVDDFESPSGSSLPQRVELCATRPEVLAIPSGYANGFRALEKNSELLIFSDFDLEASKNDDYRFPVEFWPCEW